MRSLNFAKRFLIAAAGASLIPAAAWACPACMVGDPKTAGTYFGMTVVMSALPNPARLRPRLLALAPPFVGRASACLLFVRAIIKTRQAEACSHSQNGLNFRIDRNMRLLEAVDM